MDVLPTLGREPALAAAGLELAYGRTAVVSELDVEIPANQVTVVLGPNACGKSTLLRALGGLVSPQAGSVHLEGRALEHFAPRALAQRLSLLPQSPLAPDGLTVADLVARGRTPHQRWWRQWSSDDQRAVDEALAATGVEGLRDRPLETLSGGQRQRAWLALALAQQAPLLLLDEPTTFLDLAHQIEVLRLVSGLNRRDGRTVVMVLHDLNQASRYADHLVVMRDGAIVATGAPHSVITADLVEEVFGVAVRVIGCR